MAMTAQSPTETIAATRAGTRILMREGDEFGARSLQRRRRRGGVATRSAMRHMGGGVVLETPHTRAAALRRTSAGALTFSVERDQKCIAKRGVDGRGRIPATTGSGAPCAPRATTTTLPVVPSCHPRAGTLRGWLLGFL